MSASVVRSSSSSSSISSISVKGLGLGLVHGGAGGFGTRVSGGFSASAASTADWMSAFSGDAAIMDSKKMTMQNLNDRLASYLEKVRSLESVNMKLELQIREFLDKRTPSASNDYAAFFVTISDLRAQILSRFLDNQRIILQMDNAQISAEDFKLKYETELQMYNSVMADLMQLRGVRDGMTVSVTDLELQLEGLKEELVFMKKNHQEERSQLRVQCSGMVDVTVDTPQSVDLQKVMEEIREQYETVLMKNSKELEQWFQTKVESLQTEITTRSTEVNTSISQLSELKRTFQSLEISRQSVNAEIQCLQQNLQEVSSRYSIQLSQLQVTINTLETELQELRISIEKMVTDYKLLLDVKVRLELEIAEYRRLLEGEYIERKKMDVVVVNKVEETVVEEHKPRIEKRVRTIVEEVVDGRVVSISDDVQVEAIN